MSGFHDSTDRSGSIADASTTDADHFIAWSGWASWDCAGFTLPLYVARCGRAAGIASRNA
jgi:hypothetical protein